MPKPFELLPNLLAIFVVVIKRLRQYLGLSISAEIGIISALSLVICVPIFTNAVLSEVLKQELIDKANQNHRSLFSLHAYYRDDITYTPLSVENARFASQWLEDYFNREMGLKVRDVFLEMTTEALVWKPVKFNSNQQPFIDIHLYLTGNDIVPKKTKLVEGVWPASGASAEAVEGPIQVAVLEEYADSKFINVGDIYRSDGIEIEVVGIFRAIDPNDLSWFYNPETTFNKEVWVPIEYFQERLPLVIERPLYYTSWYGIVDDQSLRFNQSLDYARGMVRMEAELRGMLSKIKIDYSPVEQLTAYEERMSALMTLFYVIGAPLILLALIFISLTASMAVQQVDQETATMRGRGVSLSQVFALNLMESVVLILIALPCAFFLGWLAAILMGQTQLFLQFTRRSGLAFSLDDVNLVWVGLTCLIIIIARLVPVLGLRHTTAVSIKQEKARGSKKPLWERLYLDFLLLIPAGYAYWVLRGQVQSPEVVADLEASHSGGGQYDPLLFVASALMAIAFCMIALRLFPLIMRLLAKVSDRAFGAGSYLAVQEFARHPQEHASVMLLIMISLSLALYSASMAKTLDQWLHDSQYYQTGADLVVKEYEIPVDNPLAQSLTPEQQAQSNAIKPAESLVDLEKHLQVPGIRSATFVGKYNGDFSYGSGAKECVLMGIDRLSFPGAAFFRGDFANQSLGALMNALALNPNGVLVPQSLLDSTGLQVGDRINVNAAVGLIGEGYQEQSVIVGSYTYFPTVYPDDKPTLIMLLDTLFGGLEAATEYDVWINVQDKANFPVVLDDLKRLALKDLLLVDVRGNALSQIQQLMNQPEWVGLFGILSVGFLLTGLIPCIGFVLDTFASLRKNYVQLGILQAIGLSTSQQIRYLALERLFIMGVALICGSGIGFLISYMFVPFLQIGAGQGTPVPPFEVLIGWAESAWLIAAFGMVLLVAVIGTIVYLVRIEMFQAVKMGEAI